MPRVDRIRIDSLGGAKKSFEIEPRADINVLFGLNGRGKTTVLRTIYSALRNDSSIVAASPLSFASVDIYSFKYCETITRKLGTSDDLATKGLQGALPLHSEPPTTDSAPDLEIEDPSEQLPLSGTDSRSWISVASAERSSDAIYQALYLPVSRLYQQAVDQQNAYRFMTSEVSQQDDPAVREPRLESMFIERFNRSWSTYAAEMLAEMKAIQQAGMARIIESAINDRQETESRQDIDPEKGFQTLSAFSAKQPELRPLVERKQEFLNMYVSNPRVRSVIRDVERVQASIAELQTKKFFLQENLNKLFSGKEVTLGEDKITIRSEAGQELSLDKLSAGERQVLNLCIRVLDGSHNAVILIDEPEISLHIDWQRKILRLLSGLRPSLQIFAATHSPEIMAELDDEQIFRV